jgi:hypothetical protein
MAQWYAPKFGLIVLRLLQFVIFAVTIFDKHLA